jgi:hypothetical protein
VYLQTNREPCDSYALNERGARSQVGTEQISLWPDMTLCWSTMKRDSSSTDPCARQFALSMSVSSAFSLGFRRVALQTGVHKTWKS